MKWKILWGVSVKEMRKEIFRSKCAVMNCSWNMLWILETPIVFISYCHITPNILVAPIF